MFNAHLTYMLCYNMRNIDFSIQGFAKIKDLDELNLQFAPRKVAFDVFTTPTTHVETISRTISITKFLCLLKTDIDDFQCISCTQVLQGLP